MLVINSLFGGPKTIHIDSNGMTKSNAIRHLDHTSPTVAISNQRFGNLSYSVGSRSVYLSGIFSREGTTSMTTPTSIGVSNNLSASQSGVWIWSTDYKWFRRIDNKFSLRSNMVGRDYFENNLVLNSVSDFL